MNVTELKNLAKTLDIAGRSKMNKAELIVAIGDACYDEATAEYDKRQEMAYLESFEPIGESDVEIAFWEIVNGEAGKPRKSYNARMYARQSGYWRTNGCMRLTPKQRRRIFKKYNAQYGKLVASLA